MYDLNTEREVTNTFNDIADSYVRNYNRVVVSHNMKSAGNEAEVRDYLTQFNQLDRTMMLLIMNHIKTLGAGRVRKYVQQRVADSIAKMEEVDAA